MKNKVLIFLLLSFPILTFGQKEGNALRIAGGIDIDGKLDESVWSQAEVLTDFRQSEPIANGTPSYKTEGRILYDDQGIYVGIKCYQEPETILKQMSARDEKENVDWAGFTVDPYKSGISGFDFLTTVTGVQEDKLLTSKKDDKNWNAVWDVATSIVSDGWVAEFFVPFSAIRFPDKDIQTWNFQIGREVRHLREKMYWSPLDPNVDGYINQCGVLHGVKDIKTPVRLSLTPFVVGYVNHNSGADAGSKSNQSFSAGMDLKYGINDAFTLDMTLIPDFGQVQSDNVEVNLGPFEQFFEENRQFFTEGVDLFDKGRLFYTRRIGGRPVNYYGAYRELEENESVVANPSKSRLLNATKITGRTAGGTGIGFFNAVVGEEFALVRNELSQETRRVKTNPYTNYNAFVIDQNLANNSSVSLINTSTLRLDDTYDANVTGVFFDLRDKGQEYNLSGKVVLSQRYNEDADNSYGHSYSISGGKVGGRYQATATAIVESDDYNPNDLGFLFSPNEQSLNLRLKYNEYAPRNKKLVKYDITVRPQYQRLYKPNVYANFKVNVRAFALYKTRVGIGTRLELEPFEGHDYFSPRTYTFSEYFRTPRSYQVAVFGSSDYRKRLAARLEFSYKHFDQMDWRRYYMQFKPRIRFSDRFSLFGDINYTYSPNQLGWVNGRPYEEQLNDFGVDDIMYGSRDRKIFNNSVKIEYIFNNKMALSVRARHYWDQFTYNRFSKLADKGHLQTISFDGMQDGDPVFDRNVNIFNIDLFYTWRFAPGSDVVLGWKNSIYTSDDRYDDPYLDNLSGLFDANQLNSLSLRVIYYLDYNQLVKRN